MVITQVMAASQEWAGVFILPFMDFWVLCR